MSLLKASEPVNALDDSVDFVGKGVYAVGGALLAHSIVSPATALAHAATTTVGAVAGVLGWNLVRNTIDKILS